MTLTFGALPKPTRTKLPKYHAEVEALRNNTGMWAKFNLPDTVEYVARNSLASNIKRGNLKAFSEGTFEARVINGDLWVRHV